jgi:hypothetical protein
VLSGQQCPPGRRAGNTEWVSEGLLQSPRSPQRKGKHSFKRFGADGPSRRRAGETITPARRAGDDDDNGGRELIAAKPPRMEANPPAAKPGALPRSRACRTPSQVGPRVRIRFPPARSQQRTLWLPGASHAGGTQSSNPLAKSHVRTKCRTAAFFCGAASGPARGSGANRGIIRLRWLPARNSVHARPATDSTGTTPRRRSRRSKGRRRSG